MTSNREDLLKKRAKIVDQMNLYRDALGAKNGTAEELAEQAELLAHCKLAIEMFDEELTRLGRGN